MVRWQRLVPALGALIVVVAICKAVTTLLAGGGVLAAGLNLVLLSALGLVMLGIRLWLPRTTIDGDLYPRIAAWIFGGIAVMSVVLALRVIHPGVDVEFSSGTPVVSFAIGSIAGFGIGVHEAKAITSARTLERQNEELKRAQEVERQNDELKETQERLERAIVQLERSNDRLEEFASVASHDLQEPLRMVSSYLRLLERGYGDDLDADAAEFIAFAVDGAERMRRMIDGLLEYSRVETQGEPFESTDLNAVLDDVLTDLQFRIEETGAEVTRESLPTVDGDDGQLRQVFQNLIVNAIEYTDDRAPRVHVSAERDGLRWVLSIRDEGIGIDPDDRDRIFTLFQRLHTREEHEGSGIGLALCKRVVERHGGEIWVDSAPGEGATFSFTIPTYAGPSTDPVTDPRRAA